MALIDNEKLYENIEKILLSMQTKDLIDIVQMSDGIYKAKEDDGSETMNWAYIVRSFVKLNNLGVIVSDYTTTVGTTSNLNIDRFHITLFGELILEYV